jgi:prepilin-type N-terminal cleavage/methylation domain-containing protein
MITSPLSRRAFTLVEMLVAISVMSFMLLAMAQMTALSEQAWRAEQNRIDNYTKARAMLSLLTDDLQRGVFRGDLPAFGTNAPSAPTVTGSGIYYYTNTAFTAAFYTRQPGLPPSTTTSVRDVSLVSYNLTNAAAVNDPAADKVVLQRADLYVPWTAGSANLAFQGDMATALKNVTAQEMAPGVVGFGLAFRRADGTLIAPQDLSSYTGYSATSTSSNPVVAVDVCLAVIGKESLAELNTTQVQAIQTALANDVTSANLNSTTYPGGRSIKSMWDKQELPTFYTGTYPKDLGSGLKTFEVWVACQPF